MKSKQELYNQIKQFYKEKFGIDAELVDIVSVFDILKLCASGASNKSISCFLDESEILISQIVDAYLGFNGWKEDLFFSPLKLYKDLESPEEVDFVNKVVEIYGYKWNMDLHRMYESARLAEDMEKLLDEKWV